MCDAINIDDKIKLLKKFQSRHSEFVNDVEQVINCTRRYLSDAVKTTNEIINRITYSPYSLDYQIFYGPITIIIEKIDEVIHKIKNRIKNLKELPTLDSILFDELIKGLNKTKLNIRNDLKNINKEKFNRPPISVIELDWEGPLKYADYVRKKIKF